jgi:anti-anti-sigma regulatory factor
MIGITWHPHDPQTGVLAVHGWVTGSEVALLVEEGERRLQAGIRLTVDLDEVRFIDPAGLDLLERWVRQGVGLRGGSLFIRTLLERQGLASSKGGED